ncbi:MAG: ABC transporter substrate-binding protein [Anaerolineae bacterium]|nr:ABC transporter substrate-binding protein [Anaerolineae bacterium]
MKRLSLIIIVLFMVFASFPAAQAQDNASTVTMAFVEGEPGSLDPVVADTINEFLVLRNVYEGLVSYDPQTLQPIPGLAEKWDVSADGLTYTFHLRSGVKFHNGRVMTAKDVKYSLERLANPQLGKSYTRFLLDGVKGIDAVVKGTARELEGLKVVDNQTIQITLSHPVASFLNQLTLPGAFVVPQEAAEKQDFAEKPVGTGPYKFVQWVRKHQVNLEANPDYWGSQPKIKYVVLRVIPDSLQQVDSFKTGKVDITVVPPFMLQRLQSDSALAGQLHEVAPLAVTYLVLNLKDPALSKLEVRQALNMAIDRSALLKTVLKGQGSEAQGFIPPLLTAYESQQPFPHDHEVVKQLLAKAGYANGLNLEVSLATDETDKRMMAVIQAQLAEAGINLAINSMDKATFDTNRQVCKGQMFVSTWTGDYADPENFTTLLLDSSTMRSSCGYGDYPSIAEVKTILLKASEMQPGTDRNALYRQAQQIAMQHAISVPIYFRSKSVLIKSTLEGAYLDATLSINFANISVKN